MPRIFGTRCDVVFPFKLQYVQTGSKHLEPLKRIRPFKAEHTQFTETRSAGPKFIRQIKICQILKFFKPVWYQQHDWLEPRQLPKSVKNLQGVHKQRQFERWDQNVQNPIKKPTEVEQAK